MLSLQNTRYFSVARKKHIEHNATSPGSFSTINTPIRPVSKERNVRTNVVGIFMSTSTGNTDQAAECIRKHLVSHTTNHANLIHPTSTTRAEIDATSFSQISQNVETSVVFDVGDVQVKEDTGMRVDHVDVGVAVVRESLSDVALEPLYGRRAPLGIQTSPTLLWIEGEVNLVRVSIVLLQTFTKSLELGELPGVQAFRFDNAAFLRHCPASVVAFSPYICAL